MELRRGRRRRLCRDNKWGELPRELLDLIAQDLTTAQDFCRFGAVCTSWHKAAVQANYRPNADHQVPWFMTPLPSNMTGSSSTRIKRQYTQHRFYDPCTGRSHKLRLPVASTSRTRVVGSDRGWLVFHENQTREAWLLNPLTGAQVYPLLAAGGENSVKVLCLSGSPSDGRYINLFHDMPLVQQRRNHSLHALESFATFKGHFYGVDCTRNMLFVVDEDKFDGLVPLLLRDFAALPPRPKGRYTCTLGTRTFLVPGVDDLLLCVTTLPNDRCGAWKWQLYRVEMEEDGGGKLVRMGSLGDGAVFISDKSSHYVSRLPRSSRGCNCKRNSVYFHNCKVSIEGEVVIWEYNLEDGVTKPFYRYKTSDLIPNPSVWMVPNLW